MIQLFKQRSVRRSWRSWSTLVSISYASRSRCTRPTANSYAPRWWLVRNNTREIPSAVCHLLASTNPNFLYNAIAGPFATAVCTTAVSQTSESRTKSSNRPAYPLRKHRGSTTRLLILNSESRTVTSIAATKSPFSQQPKNSASVSLKLSVVLRSGGKSLTPIISASLRYER